MVRHNEYGIDPGWKAAFAPKDGLARLRFMTVFVIAIAVLFTVGALISKLIGSVDRDGGTTAAIVVGVTGLLALVVQFLVMRRIDLTTATSEGNLSELYNKRFFLGLAVAEIPALVGFVAFISTDNWFATLIGTLFTVDSALRIRPTFRALVADQRLITESGSELDLITALRRPPGTLGQ